MEHFLCNYLNIPLCSSCQFCILSSHCSFVSLCCSNTLWTEIVTQLHWLSFYLLTKLFFFKPCGTTYAWRNLNIPSYILLIFSPKHISLELQKIYIHLKSSVDSLFVVFCTVCITMQLTPWHMATFRKAIKRNIWNSPKHTDFIHNATHWPLCIYRWIQAFILLSRKIRIVKKADLRFTYSRLQLRMCITLLLHAPSLTSIPREDTSKGN